MNKYFLYAASVLALASCSSDDFLGENSGNVQNASSAINFGGDAGKITRATSNTGDYVKMLDGQFKIYGVKKMSETQFVTVFKDYSVWNAAANTTTSNTNGWEYVGAKGATNLGTGNISLDKDQTIKFWDYSASEYRFVAGSPISAFTYNVPVTDESKEIKSATITGLAGHINANEAGQAITTNPVYIAEPIVVKKTKYQEPVLFSFKRQQAMVRVGLYETIPGYSITEINFYKAGGSKAEAVNNIILTSGTENYFVGGSDVKGTITYDWTGATPSYTYTYDKTNLTQSQNWCAGKFEPHNALATVSTAAVAELYGKDNDMSTNGYFTVIPTPSATKAAPILIKCDYTLTSDDDSGETIKVTGATAAIPAAFSKWEANTRYTYLFKISQNTNGTTGNPENPEDKVGLYPITFDAFVTEMTDKTQGTTTTVATPSITTYQEGSVTNEGIEYKPNKEIKVTVTDAKGNVQALTAGGSAEGSVVVYKFNSAINEAEIQVKGTNGATSVTGTVANDVFTFTPDGEGYYAIQYLTKAAIADPETPAAYTYKVVHVTPAP